MWHVSHITGHLSPVTCPLSPVSCKINTFFIKKKIRMPFLSFKKNGQRGEASWWRVCYQRILSRLVSLLRQKRLSKEMIFQWTDLVMCSWRGTWRGRWLNEAWGNCPAGEQFGKGGLWLKKLGWKNSKMKLFSVKKALFWRERVFYEHIHNFFFIYSYSFILIIASKPLKLRSCNLERMFTPTKCYI